MHIGTHSGQFHADETYANASISLIMPVKKITRSRDLKVLAACDMRIDVGKRYCAVTGDFDHHQAEIPRPNGVLYAAFGLIWKHFGVQICGGDAMLAQRIDTRLVQPIDMADTGQLQTVINAYTVKDAIDAFNPCWDEDPTGVDEAFAEAVEAARIVIRNAIRRERSAMKAEVGVRKALAERTDPRVLILGPWRPWEGVVAAEAPDLFYVVYQGQEGRWRVQAVSIELGGMPTRKPFPQSWRGKIDQDCAAATGVADAVYCSLTGHISVALSFEGAMHLAQLALQA